MGGGGGIRGSSAFLHAIILLFVVADLFCCCTGELRRGLTCININVCIMRSSPETGLLGRARSRR